MLYVYVDSFILSESCLIEMEVDHFDVDFFGEGGAFEDVEERGLEFDDVLVFGRGGGELGEENDEAHVVVGGDAGGGEVEEEEGGGVQGEFVHAVDPANVEVQLKAGLCVCGDNLFY